eukprot:symbB.v1.2.028111.t1/scaffold2945.1/size66705/2
MCFPGFPRSRDSGRPEDVGRSVGPPILRLLTSMPHVPCCTQRSTQFRIEECAYQYEGDPYWSEITAVQVAEGKFRQSKGVTSIEIIWTGCRWRELIESQDPNQEYDSGWRADRQVPIKTELPLPGRPLSGLPLPLTLGDSNGRLNVAELCEAWRKADRRRESFKIRDLTPDVLQDFHPKHHFFWQMEK